jgi:hypothetical protein
MRVAVIVALWVLASVPAALVVAAVIRTTRGTELSEEVEFYLRGLSARHGTGLLRRVRMVTVGAIGVAAVVAAFSGLGRVPSRVYAVADSTRELFGAGPGPHEPPAVDVQAVDDVPIEAATDDAGGATATRRGDTRVVAGAPQAPGEVTRAPDLAFTDEGDGDDEGDSSDAGTGDDGRRSPSGVVVHRGDDAPESDGDDERADEPGDHEHDRDRDRHHHGDDHDDGHEPAPTPTTTAPPPADEATTTTTTQPPAADEPPAGEDPPPADTDGDGVADDGDRDLDGDAIENADDADVDGDGVENADDADIDGDGIANADDPTPNGYIPEDDGHDDNVDAPPADGDHDGDSGSATSP